ncbi:hypothetical protein AMAG_12255 [Allomyces macrogynus ATCC 38327]|uniref:DUF7727 domain-containing protein n=1 Tax=Allomyces macrogynus (strain ATCC 38327) TaxID=578462 RepID=A0A0L0SX98_ALLM3|nr:hypothetical protein AMAG_12255 [Allomyces macrogynus ATCC 38327]|eukprot:KNE67188.1 hypothetical protein AMAG_12255 [Allomyces macrogynus ATCC 38327]
MGKIIWSMWGHYMGLTTAACLIDGGFLALAFSWPSLDIVRKTLPILYRPLSIPGVAAIGLGLLALAVEQLGVCARCPNALKFFLYLVTALVAGLQFSCVIGAQFAVVTAIVYLRAAVAGETTEEKSARDRVGPAKV